VLLTSVSERRRNTGKQLYAAMSQFFFKHRLMAQAFKPVKLHH